MVLFFDDGKTFATGACPYEYIRATEGDTNRIFLAVEVAGYPIEAIVDTGAPYVILAPQVARAIGFQPADALERLTMLIRGMRLDGSITRFNMTLVAKRGENLDLQATVFVPDAEELWGDFPSFIGLSGFLERIRFAIDPLTDTFYFGSMALTEL
ncbi:MAG: retroviral-like aspartic protease family protein [Hormoscilla sp. GUM202]|nr:retroviral-like aspartic protease family protein [Hormoscilla sp. GUM202]